MKQIFTFVFFLFVFVVNAQPPQRISYQAVIRNASNVLVANTPIGMRVSVLQGSATGTEVYKEVFNPNPVTNGNGLVTVEIGGGTPVTGTFAGINWANGPFFVKIETDPGGGTNYTITSVSQLLSVPYALFSGNGVPGNGTQNQTLGWCNGKPSWGPCIAKLITTGVSNITAGTANTGGEISDDGGNTVTARGVVWSTSTNPTTALLTKTSDGTGSGTFASNISGLSPNTTYYVRAYATNSAGTAYGNELSFTTLTAASATINNGLIAYYPFSGNAGDSSGNGRHGTVNGASLTTDRFGIGSKAYSFNGTSSYITTPNVAVQGSLSRCITFWVKTTSTSGAMIVATGVGDNSINGGTFNLRLVNSNKNIGFMGGNFTAANYDYFPTTGATINNGLWHHVAVNFESGVLTFYVDGVLDNTTSLTLSTSGQANFIGKSNDAIVSNAAWFNGVIDDVRYYSRILTQAEITYLATH